MKPLIHLVTHYAAWMIITAMLLLGVGIWYGTGVFSSLSSSDKMTVDRSESSDVASFTQHNFPQSEAKVILLYSAKHSLTVDSPIFRHEVERLNQKLAISSIKSFYTTGSPQFVSRDRTKTYMVVDLKNGTDTDKYKQLTDFRAAATSDILTVNTGGTIVVDQESTTRIEHDLVMAEAISLPILAVLLLFIFRGVIAAGLPLLLGILAIVGGLSVVRLLTHFTNIDQYSINVITFLGLGLSVDYSLLIVARFREELAAGASTITAVRHTMDKAGRTIIVSGLIVMASLLSLAIFPVSLLKSVGLGGASVLLIAMFAALTVLPALLMTLGPRINKWRIPGTPRRAVGSPVWHRIGTVVLKQPLVLSLVVIIAILAIASPALHMQFKPTDFSILPRSSQTYLVNHTFQTDFNGVKPTIDVLYNSTQPLMSTSGIAAAYDFVHDLQRMNGVTNVTSIVSADPSLSKHMYQQLYLSTQLPPALATLKRQLVHNDTMVVNLEYAGEPGDTSAQQLVADLRALHPAQASIQVGGQPASQYDLLATVQKLLPYALGLIMLTMLVLMTLLLRSIVIPLTSMFINTFALLATFGIIVWIFQWGHLTNDSWLLKTGGLDVTTPVLIFAIAFGLSMDYAVFLYSRIHEQYLIDKDTKTAILHGLERTGPLITQAATLFFVVVSAFASSGIAILQQIGIGLALAVLLDAFVVRIVFVPAVMKLFGRANWWLPIRK